MTSNMMDENFNWDSAYLLHPSSMGNTRISPTACVIHAQTLALLTLALNRIRCVDGGLHSDKGYTVLHREEEEQRAGRLGGTRAHG